MHFLCSFAQARLCGIICILLGWAFMSLFAVALGASQGQIVRMFTNDEEVLQAVEGFVYWAMAYQVRCVCVCVCVQINTPAY